MSIASPAYHGGYFYVRAGNNSPKSIQGDTADSAEIERPIYRTINASTELVPDSERAYGAIYKAIKRLAEAPDEPGGIDHETEREAIDWTLKLLNYKVPPPKIFSNGGDTVVFVWKSVDSGVYMTPCGQKVGIYHVGRRGKAQTWVDTSKTAELRRLISYLGGEA
jgi:hypothetical protein